MDRQEYLDWRSYLLDTIRHWRTLGRTDLARHDRLSLAGMRTLYYVGSPS